jgi:drug/metabolite transporter (DMT)-like permease
LVFWGNLHDATPAFIKHSWGLMALASAISSGFVYIELRKMSATEKSITIVTYFMLACSLGGLLSLPFQMVIPTPTTL